LLGKNLENSYLKSKKKKTGLLIFTGVLAFLLIATFLFGLWIKTTIENPNSKNNEKKSVTIANGQGLEEISNELKDAGLVRNTFVFGLYLKYKGMAGRVMAGEYQIPRNLTMIELASLITEGKIVTNKITIPEGWTIDQIGDYLEKNTNIKKVDFEAATQKKYNYNFLTGRPDGADLEGYLYPDTYILTSKPTADEVVKKMLDNFDLKFTDTIRAKAINSNMTNFEIVTLASIVEREVAKTEDRKIVAGIFLNRLNNDMPLESCATIQYILKENKKQFSYEETRTPSPYNTYINAGLPKGPIGNPSIDSIEAVISPEKTNYFYFLTGDDGQTYFSITLDEHNEKKARYLN
jgi:UPF0755 protein